MHNSNFLQKIERLEQNYLLLEETNKKLLNKIEALEDKFNKENEIEEETMGKDGETIFIPELKKVEMNSNDKRSDSAKQNSFKSQIKEKR